MAPSPSWWFVDPPLFSAHLEVGAIEPPENRWSVALSRRLGLRDLKAQAGAGEGCWCWWCYMIVYVYVLMFNKSTPNSKNNW